MNQLNHSMNGTGQHFRTHTARSFSSTFAALHTNPHDTVKNNTRQSSQIPLALSKERSPPSKISHADYHDPQELEHHAATFILFSLQIFVRVALPPKRFQASVTPSPLTLYSSQRKTKVLWENKHTVYLLFCVSTLTTQSAVCLSQTTVSTSTAASSCLGKGRACQTSREVPPCAQLCSQISLCVTLSRSRSLTTCPRQGDMVTYCRTC